MAPAKNAIKKPTDQNSPLNKNTGTITFGQIVTRPAVTVLSALSNTTMPIELAVEVLNINAVVVEIYTLFEAEMVRLAEAHHVHLSISTYMALTGDQIALIDQYRTSNPDFNKDYDALTRTKLNIVQTPIAALKGLPISPDALSVLIESGLVVV